MEGLELICFQIISAVGTSRSNYIEAIQLAKQGDFNGAEKSIEEGEKNYIIGHQAHAKLVQQEAAGTKIELKLLLLHAEDLQMSAETFGILANEFVDVYKQMYQLKEKNK